MAEIGQGGGSRRPARYKGTFRLAATRHGLVASKWPRPRGLPADRYQRSTLDYMRELQRLVKHMQESQVSLLRDALADWNRRNRGQMGAATIRLRDMLTALISGRLWGFRLANGRTVYHRNALLDISRRLDWLEPDVGSMLTRTEDGWRPTFPCQPGYVLMLTDGTASSGCCPLPAYQYDKV